MSRRKHRSANAAPDLTDDQLVDGFAACLINARRLVSSAQALLELGDHATGWALATLAQEELGKRQVLMLLAMPIPKSDKTRAWERFSDHKAKLAMLEVPDVILGTDVASGPEAQRETERRATNLHTTKLESLYVGRFVDGRWPVPWERVTAAEATALVESVAQTVAKASPISVADLRRHRLFLADLLKKHPHDLDAQLVAILGAASPANAKAALSELRSRALSDRVPRP